MLLWEGEEGHTIVIEVHKVPTHGATKGQPRGE